ncbi:lysine-rich nucleolar protein 1-like isoform X2 [Sinocyclocheilus rhinocerous]|uniref:lysine-rich nucleolar protein 1-like isoform X2 n=1 Tax=Sinocyclocheilus rhinocerous TaxID=307959 RepID=UPI0007B9BE9C|nr:PREDICTED: lysine-rich nucleolar protein 1-like isoform X2 [Sinocyclocheilus rhinocerous]
MVVDGATKEKKKKKVQDAGDTRVMSVQTDVKNETLDVNIRDGEKRESDGAEKKRKKKKKVKEDVEANSPVCYDASVQTSVKTERSDINISAAPEKTKKKKKKKKKRKIDEDVAEEEQNKEFEGGELKKKRKKQKECKQEAVKKKRRKKSSAVEEPDDISSSEKLEKKSKKLKKKLKGVDEGESHPRANGGQVSSADKKMRKKGKAKTETEEEAVGKKGRKKTPEKVRKKKPKEEHHEAVVERASKASDVVFLSEKPGNQDEVSIDQARRLRLQRDIDKESQPKPNLGQWCTAQFDSSDRQAKFLRLMGGFKKSSQPVAGSSGRANMVLGTEGQQTLQQGLLGEFERAQSRHMDFRNKGAGLGFTAPSNKTFAIDANARNSVRLDD